MRASAVIRDVAERWRGAGGGWTRRPIPLTRRQRIVVIVVVVANAFMCFLNLGAWCRSGHFISLVSCQLSAATALWMLMQNKGRWSKA